MGDSKAVFNKCYEGVSAAYLKGHGRVDMHGTPNCEARRTLLYILQ